MKTTRTRTSRWASISVSDRALLKKIGLKIHRELFEKKIPVERLAFEAGVARSSIREIIAARSNPRLLTLHAISRGLGYESLCEFLDSI